MHQIDLSGDWQISLGHCELPSDIKIPHNFKLKARVPGCILKHQQNQTEN
jgi:hypothetical protein